MANKKKARSKQQMEESDSARRNQNSSENMIPSQSENSDGSDEDISAYTNVTNEEYLSYMNSKKKAKSKRDQMKGKIMKSGTLPNKKASKGERSSVFSIFTDGDLRPKFFKWLINISIILAILCVFALKAAEEYYGSEYESGPLSVSDYFAALELDDGATEADVRKAYRALSVRWHPDRNANCPACQTRFQEVATAYEHLMRRYRAGREDDEDASSSKSTKGDDATAKFEKTSSGIIDLSSLGHDEPFYPATDNRHVWTIMLHQDKDEYSTSVYEMWQESARFMGKYVKYGVVILRKNNKHILKKLAVNIKFFPAILLMTAGSHPEQYLNIARPSLETMNRFIIDNFPNHVHTVHSVSDLKNALNSTDLQPTHPLSTPYKVVALLSSNAAEPSILLKSIAFSNRDRFQVIYLANVYSLLSQTNERAGLTKILRQPPKWLPDDNKTMLLPVPNEQWPKEVRPVSFIFVANEGQESWSIHRRLPIVKSKYINPLHTANFALQAFSEATQPLLFQENAKSLCRGTLQKHVFCLVLIDQGTKTKVIDAPKVKEWIAKSRKRYLLDNPSKDLESSHHKAILQRQREEDEEVDDEEDSDNTEDTSGDTSQANEIELENVIQVQVVRISIEKPSILPYLPGAKSSSSFLDFWNTELNHSNAFLLDLQGSRYAPIQVPTVDNSGVSPKLLENIYQQLEELQNDETGEGSGIAFKALPSYCSGQHFTSLCLPSGALPFIWRVYYWILLNGLSMILTVLSAAAAMIYFRNSITCEKLLHITFGLSVVIGALSYIPGICNYFNSLKL